MGIPATCVTWTRAWLQNIVRISGTVGVRIAETVGRPRTYKEGLPQCAVLSPLLFIIFINDLLGSFGVGTLTSAFADDLLIACSSHIKEMADDLEQEETDRVVEWSRRWRLQLNVAKCEMCLFTTDSHERSLRSTVKIEGKTSPYRKIQHS